MLGFSLVTAYAFIITGFFFSVRRCHLLMLLCAEVSMEAADMPAAPAEPVAWPCLTDPVRSLHDALQLQVPAYGFGVYWGAFRGFGRSSPGLAPRASRDMQCAPAFSPWLSSASSYSVGHSPCGPTCATSIGVCFSKRRSRPSCQPTKLLAFKQDFLKKYPSEVLDDSSMPSSRLLALAFKQASGTEWKFIPWKWRLSSAELEDMQINRPRKLPRLDLADFLRDEVSARSVTESLGMFGLSKLLRLHSVAMALVADVHFATLIWPMRPAFPGWLRPALKPALASALPTPWSANRRTKGFGMRVSAIHKHTAVRSELSALASKGSGLGSGT